MTHIELMIAGFLAQGGQITHVPAGKKAYPWAKEQDWTDAIQRHHVALEIAGQVLPIEEPAHLTGFEHSQVYAYYLADDEDTADVTDLDRAAHHAWVDGKAQDGEYEDYYPEPEWA